MSLTGTPTISGFRPLCHVTSSTAGLFQFVAVPSGKYVLVSCCISLCKSEKQAMEAECVFLSVMKCDRQKYFMIIIAIELLISCSILSFEEVHTGSICQTWFAYLKYKNLTEFGNVDAEWLEHSRENV